MKGVFLLLIFDVNSGRDNGSAYSALTVEQWHGVALGCGVCHTAEGI